MSTGSDLEPIDAAEEMAAATQRLRDKGWMVAPLTGAVDTSAPEEQQAGTASA